MCFDANFKLCEQCVDKFAPPHDDDIAVFRKRGLVNLNPLPDGYVFRTLSIFKNNRKYLGKIFEKMSYSERVQKTYHEEIEISVNILFSDGSYCVERVHKMYPFGHIKIALKTVSHGSI